MTSPLDQVIVDRAGAPVPTDAPRRGGCHARVALDVHRSVAGDTARQPGEHFLGEPAAVRRIDEHDIETRLPRRVEEV
jgi:hypothetical protein